MKILKVFNKRKQIKARHLKILKKKKYEEKSFPPLNHNNFYI